MFSENKSYKLFISSDGLLICNTGVIHRVTLCMLGNSALFLSSAFSAFFLFKIKCAIHIIATCHEIT